VGWDLISVALRRGVVTKITKATATRITLGKGLPPRLSFVHGKNHEQLLHYVSPP
jgi:hypothetical protein